MIAIPTWGCSLWCRYGAEPTKRQLSDTTLQHLIRAYGRDGEDRRATQKSIDGLDPGTSFRPMAKYAIGPTMLTNASAVHMRLDPLI